MHCRQTIPSPARGINKSKQIMQQTGSKAASRVYSYTSRGDDRSAHEAGGQALAAVVEDEADVGGEDQVDAEDAGL